MRSVLKSSAPPLTIEDIYLCITDSKRLIRFSFDPLSIIISTILFLLVHTFTLLYFLHAMPIQHFFCFFSLLPSIFLYAVYKFQDTSKTRELLGAYWDKVIFHHCEFYIYNDPGDFDVFLFIIFIALGRRGEGSCTV